MLSIDETNLGDDALEDLCAQERLVNERYLIAIREMEKEVEDIERRSEREEENYTNTYGQRFIKMKKGNMRTLTKIHQEEFFISKHLQRRIKRLNLEKERLNKTINEEENVINNQYLIEFQNLQSQYNDITAKIEDNSLTQEEASHILQELCKDLELRSTLIQNAITNSSKRINCLNQKLQSLTPQEVDTSNNGQNNNYQSQFRPRALRRHTGLF